jgi:hypothetical protein
MLWLDSPATIASGSGTATAASFLRDVLNAVHQPALFWLYVIIRAALRRAGGYPSIAETKALAGTLGFKTFRHVDDFLVLR